MDKITVTCETELTPSVLIDREQKLKQPQTSNLCVSVLPHTQFPAAEPQLLRLNLRC